MKLELLILNQLLKDEDYLRRVIPFLKDEYFTDWSERKVFQHVKTFVEQYNVSPSVEALEISLQGDKALTEEEFTKVVDIVQTFGEQQTNKEWILDETEKFCKDKAVYNAIHDYLTDSDDRFDFYHKTEERIPFDLDMFNKITKGGLPNKTLNIALAGTGVGKSLFMCHMAAGAMSQGKNVLYITMEMAEERIAERIDANLMNVTMDDLKNLPKQMFDDRISRIRNKTEGKLIIKEYPTASAHSGHFRALLNELNLKKEFRPDIIFIDYLNICASSRFKMSGSVNSYIYIKGIAEELRGLAVEFNVPIVSATQTTRSGYANSDMELTDTSESFGLPATADFMFGIISTEDLEKLGQLLIKQLKNRYNDPSQHKRFVIGVDRAKMRLYDVDASAQRNIMQEDAKVEQKPTTFTSKMFAKKNFDSIKF